MFQTDFPRINRAQQWLDYLPIHSEDLSVFSLLSMLGLEIHASVLSFYVAAENLNSD